MNTKWIRKTLAYNIRWERHALELSQVDFAKKLGLSYRLIQDLEAGKANPTLETLAMMARGLEVTVDYLLKISSVRPEKPTEDFIANINKEFLSSRFAIILRNFNNEILWINRAGEKLTGIKYLDKKIQDFLEILPSDTKGIIKQVMANEKRGVAFPYTIIIPGTSESPPKYIRSYPTLVFPKTGMAPIMTIVYAIEIEDDCHKNYYDYCHGIFRALVP